MLDIDTVDLLCCLGFCYGDCFDLGWAGVDFLSCWGGFVILVVCSVMICFADFVFVHLLLQCSCCLFWLFFLGVLGCDLLVGFGLCYYFVFLLFVGGFFHLLWFDLACLCLLIVLICLCWHCVCVVAVVCVVAYLILICSRGCFVSSMLFRLFRGVGACCFLRVWCFDCLYLSVVVVFDDCVVVDFRWFWSFPITYCVWLLYACCSLLDICFVSLAFDCLGLCWCLFWFNVYLLFRYLIVVTSLHIRCSIYY